MSLFVFSTFAGFLLYQIVARIQPISGSRSYRFGRRVVVELPERSYLVWKAASISVAVTLFVLVVILIVAQGAHPAEGYAFRFVDALTSPRMAAALFGGLVGLLLGNLLNRVLWAAHEYKFTSSDRIEMILIFFLFILGIGGEEVVRSTAQRINKVSVGTTTEISFSESKPRNSRAAAEQPGAAFRNTAGESGGPTGLGKLADLKDNIGDIDPDFKKLYRSDGDFISVIGLYEAKSIKTSEKIGTLPAKILSPIGTCLSGIYRYYGDAAFVRYQLGYLTIALRDLALVDDINEPSTRDRDQLATTSENNKPAAGTAPPVDTATKAAPDPVSKLPAETVKLTIKQHIANNLEDRVRQIAEYARTNAKMLKDPIKVAGPNKKTEQQPILARYRCTGIVNTSEDAQYLKGLEKGGSIEEFWKSRERLPYAHIAYASVEAALHNYESSATTMDNWIRARKKELDDQPDQKSDDYIKAKWYLIRARFAEGSFVEEWLRSRGVAASSWLRQYHIDNLKAIADDMQSFNAIWTLSQKNREYKWSNGLLGVSYAGDDGVCNFVPVPKGAAADGKEHPLSTFDQLTLRKLYDSYLSARNDFVDHALKHPIMKRRQASVIHNQIDELMKLDLRCIEDSRTRIRAEYIERYVRSEINLLENSSPLKSSDEVRRRIRDSQQLLSLAFQLIEPDVTYKRDGKSKDEVLQSRIEADSLLALYETLLATQSQLQDFSERDVMP